MISESTLIREYVTALRNKNASVFIGSGMSCNVFGLKWKDLIKPYAEKIGCEKISDYPFVAQAYINSGQSEEDFKKEICSKFISSDVTSFYNLIARLPIKNYWTTNYDTLIENALEKNRKRKHVIFDNNSFCTVDEERDHIVYKCHGDCKNANSIIITQSDYEKYHSNNFNFTHALYNELASNVILFLGYSFRDPDINNILSTLNTIEGTKQTHYFITKRAVGADYVLQEHWIKNLERYSIKTLLIDDYSHIQVIMEKIENKYMSNKILISGSAEEYTQFSDETEARKFINKLGYELVKYDCSSSNVGHGLKIINGNGKGIGPDLYEGVAEAAAEFGLDIADYLIMYPFAKNYYATHNRSETLEQKYKAYREKMIEKCGIVFFIFGNKYNEAGEIINADGVQKEFEIACTQKKKVFPIGATGYMAKKLAEEVLSNYELYNGDTPELKKILEELNNPQIEPNEIIKRVEKIIDTLAFINN